MNNFTRITYGRKSSVPENAALLSFRHAFSLPEAAKKEAVRDALISVFQKLIPSVSQNGIILGHLKGSIQAGGARLGLSATRADAIDQTPGPGWEELDTLQDFEIRVSLLSSTPCPITQEQMEEMIVNMI